MRGRKRETGKHLLCVAKWDLRTLSLSRDLELLTHGIINLSPPHVCVTLATPSRTHLKLPSLLFKNNL